MYYARETVPNHIVLFGDSAAQIEVRCFIRDAKRAPFVKSVSNFSIDELFRENGISVPFPQRDIRLRSSDII